MKVSKFSDSQIASILKQAESGVPVPALCRAWHQQCHLLQMAQQIRRHGRKPHEPPQSLRSREHAPEKLYAESQLHTDILKECLAKSKRVIS